MSTMETQLKSRSVSEELVNVYGSLLEKARKELPKIDVELVVNMLRFQMRYRRTPRVRLDITFNTSIETEVKRDELLKKFGKVAQIWHRNSFEIDPLITLKNLEELARDKDIEYIKGTILQEWTS